jgi:hypothetical protein
MSDGRAAPQGGQDLRALARARLREAAAAFQGGDGEAVAAAPRDADELRALVDAAWADIGRDAPAPGASYWDAGVTSLEIALFSEALGNRIRGVVEFNEVLDHPETGALADHLHTRGETDT